MDFKEIHDAVIQSDAENVKETIQQALGQEIDAETILNQGLIAAMDIVGEKVHNGPPLN